MNVSWIVTPYFQCDADIKAIGPVWGSDISWRVFNTDNAVCFDYRRAADLIARNFQEKCNFYVPEKFFGDLGRPSGVNLIGGDFSYDVEHKEEIVCSHLVSETSDIVLLGGFDFSSNFELLSDYDKHRAKNFIDNFRRIISSKSSIQWVALDHTKEIDESISSLPNFTHDATDSVISLLS